MAFSIKNPQTDRLARQLSRETGESLTMAVDAALRERLLNLRSKRKESTLAKDLNAIVIKYNRLPKRDNRTADEILGYNDRGYFD